ncbi:MAG: hydroxyacid dehydrogenase [Ktedonobacteraceae bacterium]|nr:hydroxyacid dehydrogenase [Ktedonobacteraceae bacterium]
MEQHRSKTLITEANDEERQYLSQALDERLTLTIAPGLLSEIDAQNLGEVEILVPFIHSKIGAAQMDLMPHLKLIATRSTGYDHIDLKTATERGIAVSNVPGYGENAVAEHTFALMLALSRKILPASARTQRGNYTLEGLRGFDLYGKTLGVIGAGAIGLHVIRIAKGFGMNVLTYDVVQNRLLAEILGFRYTSLDELLSQSDIITLHAPSIPATYHIINRETLAKMKPHALLINTARGSLVDTEALAWALDRGILGGAGLDTLEGEEFLQNEEELLQEAGAEEKLKVLLRNHILQRRENVVMTPHIAFNTDEALRRILDTTIENIQAFLAGTPEHLVVSR